MRPLVRPFLPGDLPAIRARGNAAVDDGDDPDPTRADVEHEAERTLASPAGLKGPMVSRTRPAEVRAADVAA